MKKEVNISNKNLVIIVIVLLLTSGLVFGVVLSFGQSTSKTEAGSMSLISSNKYTAALRRVDLLIDSYQTDLFNSSIFKTLKSFIKLPLEKGLVGKENPFELPLPPEQEFLEELLNI